MEFNIRRSAASMWMTCTKAEAVCDKNMYLSCTQSTVTPGYHGDVTVPTSITVSEIAVTIPRIVFSIFQDAAISWWKEFYVFYHSHASINC
jgi:hypothetical protein